MNKKIYLLLITLVLVVFAFFTMRDYFEKNFSNTNLPFSTPNTIITTSPRSKNNNIVTIAYFPEKNGFLDTINIIEDTYGEYQMSINTVRNKVKSLTPQVIEVLENGSTFKGYKNPDAKPYLNYKEIAYLEFLEELPSASKLYNGLPLPNYLSILEKIDVCEYVDNQNAKEIWLWSYGGTKKAGWESNFSSKYGDISNSDRDPNDLPQCKHSYTVYDYNYGRQVSEAVEDHIHQYEAIFKYIDYELFWTKYVGYFPGGEWASSSANDQKRRCGWAHFTPNSQKDYDWKNQSIIESDCENWDPNGYGQTTTISCKKWNCQSEKYFQWWMQNIPGLDNQYVYQGKKMKNWWDFIADFDEAMKAGSSLYF